jgi:hypothetical protein
MTLQEKVSDRLVRHRPFEKLVSKNQLRYLETPCSCRVYIIYRVSLCHRIHSLRASCYEGDVIRKRVTVTR